MECKECEAKNPEGAGFCGYCGEPLGEDNSDEQQRLRTQTEEQQEPEEASEPQPPRDEYGETQPYYVKRKKARRPAYSGVPRGKSRVPFILVSVLTALMSLICFALPFQMWISYNYQILGNDVSEGRLTLVELAQRFYKNDTVLPLITGRTDNFGAESLIPESVNAQYAQGRFAVMILTGVFLFSLLLWVFFIIAVICRARKTAATLGIFAALLYGSCSAAVMYGVKIVREAVEQESYSWIYIDIKILDAPYITLALSALLAVMCVIFAILGAGTGKKGHG